MTSRTLIKNLAALPDGPVSVAGWVETVRDQKKVQFVILRDETGAVQLVNPAVRELDPEGVSVGAAEALALTETISGLSHGTFVRVTGDPATLMVEPGASQEDLDAIRQKFGLDKPLWTQYVNFIVSLAEGDLGQSFYYRMPVSELYLQRLPNSLLLAAVAMAFSLIIGIPSGILAAVNVGKLWDSAGKVFALLGLSLPSFWVGLVMILVFSVCLQWLPSSGAGTWQLFSHDPNGARVELDFEPSEEP